LKLANQVAIVTGGGRGIGEATSLAMAGEGARLVLAARTLSEVQQVAERIIAGGGAAVAVAADVSQPDQVARLVEAALRSFQQVDILVNCAGVYGPIGRLWELNGEEWRRALEVNVYGTFLCCQAVLPHLIARRRGSIINFSGGGAAAPLPRFSAYGTSKAAVVRLTETLAEEVRELGITVNAIAPGAVNTRLQDAVLEAGERAGDLLGRIERLRQTGEGGVPPELAARLAVFLASEDAAGLTGKLIAAPYDGWESWDRRQVEEWMRLPWFTLRRLDRLTLRPFLESRTAPKPQMNADERR